MDRDNERLGEREPGMDSPQAQEGGEASRESAALRGILDVSGTWDMVHDDFRGTLVIRPSDQVQVGIDGPCEFRSRVIDGTYTGGDGVQRSMRGRLGGRDPYLRRPHPCPQSGHFLSFTINFGNGLPPQPFEGYVSTHQGRVLAGITWWTGLPFNWYAVRRP